MLLADRTVVLVDPDAASTEMLTQHLRSQGARCFHARDAATAAWGVRETLPDVIVSELELPDLDADTLLLELRSSPYGAGVPAIGLSANKSLLARAQALPRRFEKFLAKPTRLPELTDAICCVLGSRALPPALVHPSLEELALSIERHDYRRLLLTLNALTGYRYTALFRSDESELRSVWTFDRERPTIDPFPSHLPIEETPCARVLAERQSLGLADASADPLMPRTHRREEMRAFAGVPWFDDDESLIGALCHFDPAPLDVDPAALEMLERVARLFLFVNRRPPKSAPPR